MQEHNANKNKLGQWVHKHRALAKLRRRAAGNKAAKLTGGKRST
jgi:hypothetical protein